MAETDDALNDTKFSLTKRRLFFMQQAYSSTASAGAEWLKDGVQAIDFLQHALAERDAQIERLEKGIFHLEKEEMQATLRATTAERERDEALEQLRMQWCLACGAVSADGECDCTSEPDTASLRQAVDYATEFGKMVRETLKERDEARAEVERLRDFLWRYRTETPLGHQPHMIAAEVDAALTKGGENGER